MIVKDMYFMDNNLEKIYEPLPKFEFYKKKLLDLKQKIERDLLVNEKVEEALKDVKIISTIFGLKPVSILKIKNTPYADCSNEDLIGLRFFLKKQGVRSLDVLSEEGGEVEELIFCNEEKSKEVIANNKTIFNDEDIEKSKIDFPSFMKSIRGFNFQGKYRKSGILFGYPISDVEDYERLIRIYEKYSKKGIKPVKIIFAFKFSKMDKLEKLINDNDLEFLKRKKRVKIEGLNQSLIAWTTFGSNEKETEKKIKDFEELVKAQKEVFG